MSTSNLTTILSDILCKYPKPQNHYMVLFTIKWQIGLLKTNFINRIFYEHIMLFWGWSVPWEKKNCIKQYINNITPWNFVTSLNISYCLLAPRHGVTTVTWAKLSFNFAVFRHETEICADLQKIFATCIRAVPVET